ncbi:MAG: hypothetical protein QOK40_88 [Miltoncostaeaceae bacterium]|nr:hypothetical protein [Miltoncostaeaceae bacterium]
MPPLALFAAAYLGATLALTQESMVLAGVALGLAQVAALLLLARRPDLVRRRLRAKAPPALAAAEAGSQRARGWRLTSALVEHGRSETSRPLCEAAGPALQASREEGDWSPLTFWAISDGSSGAAVEIFRSRVLAETVMADAAAREPAAASRLSLVRLDFAALAGISADGGSAQRSGLTRAGRSVGAGGSAAPAPPPEWIIRPGA